MVKIRTNTLIYEELKRQLKYNPFTGYFYWRISPTKNVKIGTVAGYKNPDAGYIEIRINGVGYRAHRLAWFYYYGYMPENEIDHRDRIKYHNWILNLRQASKQCNAQNKGNPKNNTSGVRGVSWSKGRKKWCSQICVNKKGKFLGYNKDFNEAVCVRLAAEQCVNWAGCYSNSPAYLYVKENIQGGPDW